MHKTLEEHAQEDFKDFAHLEKPPNAFGARHGGWPMSGTLTANASKYIYHRIGWICKIKDFDGKGRELRMWEADQDKSTFPDAYALTMLVKEAIGTGGTKEEWEQDLLRQQTAEAAKQAKNKRKFHGDQHTCRSISSASWQREMASQYWEPVHCWEQWHWGWQEAYAWPGTASAQPQATQQKAQPTSRPMFGANTVGQAEQHDRITPKAMPGKRWWERQSETPMVHKPMPPRHLDGQGEPAAPQRQGEPLEEKAESAKPDSDTKLTAAAAPTEEAAPPTEEPEAAAAPTLDSVIDFYIDDGSSFSSRDHAAALTEEPEDAAALTEHESWMAAARAAVIQVEKMWVAGVEFVVHGLGPSAPRMPPEAVLSPLTPDDPEVA